MSFRLWLFAAGLSAAAAVLAGAYGTHALFPPGTFTAPAKIYETAQLYHFLHSIALFGVALLLAATEGRRRIWATWLIQIAGLAFVVGILLFSGGIYYHILKALQTPNPVVPAGGMAFVTGWAVLALSTFGFRRTPGQAT